MDLDDILALLWPLILFAISIIGRVARFRRNRKTSPNDRDGDLERNEVQQVDDRDAEEVYEEFEEEPYVEVGPESSGPARSVQDTQADHRQRLTDVFRNLGLEVSFGDPQPEEPASDDVTTGEEWNLSELEGSVDEEFVAEETGDLLAELDSERRAALARAATLRSTRHLNARSVRSAEVVRDAIVLDALLHRPQWGRLPLKRRSG